MDKHDHYKLILINAWGLFAGFLVRDTILLWLILLLQNGTSTANKKDYLGYWTIVPASVEKSCWQLLNDYVRDFFKIVPTIAE